MQSKILIITADDLGNSHEINKGVLKGIQNGIITSTCLMANGPAFEEAKNEILPQIKTAGMGVHLDIIENKSLLYKNSKSLLTDVSGQYNNSYIELIKKSNNKNFLTEVEAEFRSQMEKVMEVVDVDHINSHVHTHAIPPIFEIACKLAEEYGIKYIRTQYEKNYFIPSQSFNFKYPVNLVKTALLNTFSLINKVTAKEFNVETNDCFIGVRYTGMMTVESILAGMDVLDEKNLNVEVLIHPYYFETLKKCDSEKFNEFLLTESDILKKKLNESEFSLGTFSSISQHEKFNKSSR